jgi:hypothetical protein
MTAVLKAYILLFMLKSFQLEVLKFNIPIFIFNAKINFFPVTVTQNERTFRFPKKEHFIFLYLFIYVRKYLK